MPVPEPVDPSMPVYSELPLVPGSEERHAWDVWGRHDQLGTVNFITPASVRAGARTVKEGTVVSLSAGINDTEPGLFPRRKPASHEMMATPHGRDDRLDGFYPQFGSQWDGLRHVKFRSHGYWGGRTDEDLDTTDDLGIHHWAHRGIISRGVLIDVVEHCRREGRPFGPEDEFVIGVELLDDTLVAQGSEVRPGDIVLVRTGWIDWYLELGLEERFRRHGKVGAAEDAFTCPGLESSRRTAAWLWDHRVAAIVADNPAVEVMPVSRVAGFLHYRLIPLLGMPLGEMWTLKELGDLCRSHQRYDFFVSGGVLKVPGGVGSPASAYAVL
ncbi:MAG: cyclase family protein [Actinomycetota bacterium]|nr:cyclase family protein [Actinomycetota bacterium]